MSNTWKHLRLFRIDTDLRILVFAKWAPSIVFLVTLLCLPIVLVGILSMLNILVFFDLHPIFGNWIHSGSGWLKLQIIVTCLGLAFMLLWLELKLVGWAWLSVRMLFGFKAAVDRRIADLQEKRERIVHE